MALTPKNTTPESEKRAKQEESEQDALLREVDEAVRQDQFTGAAKRYGISIAALIVVGLAGFGGWLWWSDQQEGKLERASEEIVRAIDQIEAGNLDTASQALTTISENEGAVSATVAKIIRAGLALEQGNVADAVALFAEVSADTNAPKPYRDLATIREIAANYDNMKPADVEARLKPLAMPGTPFFGSAGELLGAAYLDQDKQDLAGPLFAEIAKDETVPGTLRSRARQLAGLMGVDAIVDVDQTLQELNENSAPQGVE